MKMRTLVIVFSLSLTACGGTPTEIAAPETPRLEGGMMFGGGTTADTTCDAERGGMMFGGGTYSDPCPEPESAS